MKVTVFADDCAKYWPLDGDLVLEVRQCKKKRTVKEQQPCAVTPYSCVAGAVDNHSSKKPPHEIGKVYCLCRGPDDGTDMFQVTPFPYRLFCSASTAIQPPSYPQHQTRTLHHHQTLKSTV